jgi:hypothetical protein
MAGQLQPVDSAQPRRRRITQAAITKTIRAALEAGLTIARIVTLADGVSIETAEAPHAEPATKDTARSTIIL